MISLKVEIGADTTILQAATEAQELAQHLRVTIDFDFNGVQCTVFRDGSPQILQEKYHAALKRKSLRYAFNK